ncbi:hypothetical protein I6A84_41670 [Frankia sp. CNm7]|uniref:Uncharacterized protein n=1 Tax=Frankia nepalensis TaxID=1836974 RepID=A0A937UJL5_9ACTN|nr:hypothetical protein [Frankia nepalensis]MBL7499126.1 hypothetical protein [Frankia nepalensis]MBL7515156.1 hypothetical protein [Frankia nepalensis]MBL7524377.1 hypothetical protein [Frankia nepalensis]MBL7625919.1 hypothetical protein [Frankia nepalensis]
MARMTAALVAGYFAWWERRRLAAATGRGSGTRGGDRGDVPGWVMVTVMTAALVVAIATIATPALQNMFTTAINKVSGAGGGGDGG